MIIFKGGKLMSLITTKNVTEYEPQHIFSDLFKEILETMFPTKDGDKPLYKLKLSRTFNDSYMHEDILTYKEFKDIELSQYNKTISEGHIRDRYNRYNEEYYASKHVILGLEALVEVYDYPPTTIMYYRVCPVTNKSFYKKTLRDVLDIMENLHRFTYDDGIKGKGEGYISFKKWHPRTSPFQEKDELKLQDRYHPSVVKQIVYHWDKKPMDVNINMEDGTLLGTDLANGSAIVLYNKSGISIQKLKIYTNTKGMFYKIRGKKRVYLDLPSINIR